ncbi:MAG: RidA family protein [bacterium]
MNYDDKLEELFIDLPEPAAELGSAVGAVAVGKTLYVGGALPLSEGRIQYPGRAGVEVKTDNAKMAARLAGVMTLAIARQALGGSLNSIRRVIRVDGFVAAGVDFREHAKVVDGAGELFAQIFGANGKHVRNAIGCASLPQNACVELSVMFEVK